MTPTCLIPLLLATSDAGWGFILLLLVAIILALLAAHRRDAGRKRDLEEKIAHYEQRRRIAFDYLHTLGDAFQSGVQMEEMMKAIVRFAVKTSVASAGTLFVREPGKDKLTRRLTIGTFPPLKSTSIERETFALNEGLIGQATQDGRCLMIRDATLDDRIPKPPAGMEAIQSLIIVPLKFREQVLGVVAVINKQPDSEFARPLFNNFDFFLLDALSAQVSISLYLGEMFALQSERQRLDADLRLASEVQQLLLPDKAPELAGFDIAGASKPAQQIGGDYFDFLKLDDTRLGIAIADASGKGISGALVMAMCRSAMRGQMRLAKAPANALCELNRQVASDLREDAFITLLYGVLDAAKRTFRFARAGHDPLLCFRAATNTVDVLTPKGVAIGLDREGQLDNLMAELEIQLSPGDIIALYTDGITESADASGNEFGRNRLMELLKSSSGAGASQIAETVFESVNKFTQGAPLSDDQTLVVIKAN